MGEGGGTRREFGGPVCVALEDVDADAHKGEGARDFNEDACEFAVGRGDFDHVVGPAKAQAGSVGHGELGGAVGGEAGSKREKWRAGACVGDEGGGDALSVVIEPCAAEAAAARGLAGGDDQGAEGIGRGE